MKMGKLWGGRFEELPSKGMVEFLSGRDVRGIPPCDERLIPYDLWGDRAHILMLCRQGILSKQDGKRILKGLKEIETLRKKGSFRLDASKEDVHSNIESYLIERVGIESGGKVHTLKPGLEDKDACRGQSGHSDSDPYGLFLQIRSPPVQ